MRAPPGSHLALMHGKAMRKSCRCRSVGRLLLMQGHISTKQQAAIEFHLHTHVTRLERRLGLVHRSCAPHLARWWGADLVERAGPILGEDGHEQAVQPESKVANLGAIQAVECHASQQRHKLAQSR